tara:strand:- start:417 stop:758 length:342 start_codon:yes stop_codon:yes gene_type:complete
MSIVTLIENIYNMISNMFINCDNENIREYQYKKVHNEGLELFLKKNQDYGDAFANYGTIGVLVRLQDKLSRLMSVDRNSLRCVDDETMRDTLIDLHNYSAMAIMLMDEQDENE